MRVLMTLCLLLSSALCSAQLMAADAITLIGDTGGVNGSIPGMKFSMGLGAWGPKWTHMGFRGTVTNKNGEAVAQSVSKVKATNARVTCDLNIAKQGANALTFSYALSSDKTTDLTMAMVAIDPGKNWKGHLVSETASGDKTKLAWPIGRDGAGSQVSKLTLNADDGYVLSFSFNPAVDIPSDRAMRVVIAKNLEAGKYKELEITMESSKPINFHPTINDAPDEDGKDTWFVWSPKYTYKDNNAFVMNKWTSEPAGSKGRMTSSGDQLIYDGKPIKIWGLNNCFSNCAPDKALADRRADFYAAHGINAVRLHKYADGAGWAGILKQGTMTEFDKAGLDKMDYYIAALKKRGIFVKLSSSFGSPGIGADDWDKIPYAKEWGPKPKGRKLLKTGSGAVYISKELQDLQIEQMTRLLQHENPYTGLTYADDPGIMLVELVNEESALFYGTIKQLKTMKTPRAQVAKQFTEWLLDRYGSEEAVMKRWGEGMLGTFKAEGFGKESFADKSLVPAGNPWFWDPDNINGSQKSRAPRLYDAALFLKKLQDDYYDRYTKAIREAGYEGELMASNWQAGRASSHFYNLHSDQRIGMIDRHNYFGGAHSMVTVAGGGSLSSGMQQVEGRPFSLSEWIHVWPNQYGVEGPAIIGAYGLGLQGWDVSFLFQNGDDGSYTKNLGRHNWDVTAPQVFGVFPAVARQVRRGDIKQSDLTIPLNVHLDSLHEGKVGFSDKTEQAYDIKLFNNDKVPARSLAVGRVAVTYKDVFTETPIFDVDAHKQNGGLVSSTKELQWFEGDAHDTGYFTVNTAACKAVVGFSQGTNNKLGDVTIQSESAYGALYVSAASKDKTIADDKRLIIVAIARAHNTGMKYLNGKMLTKGKPPIVMEPMKATITIKRAGAPTVYICDHDGNRTDKTIPVSGGSFTIDGASSKTTYYEIAYE